MIELWGQAVRSIEAKVKPAHRDQWLKPIECVAISNGRVRLKAPNRYHKEWFEDHYLPSILRDLEERSGPAAMAAIQVTELPTVELPSTPPPRALEPRYTFDKFVVGPTNQFAHAAARMVADAPASKWNPLFIYGGVGLGKTHLLHAVGHEIHRQHPDWNITV